MPEILSALFWLSVAVALCTALYIGLSRRSRRIVQAYQSLHRRAPANTFTMLADIHVRRALWFALLDHMHDRYTVLLQAARATRRGNHQM